MKHLVISSLFALHLALLSLSAAVPVTWDVDLDAQPPQVFTLQRPRGEAYDLEAVLKIHGKPFASAITNACIYWQTNGMENLYWSAPASVSNNVLRASWLPSMDPGAPTVRGYIGDPGHVYAAAFQFRFTPSPGAMPNLIEQPQRVLDLAHTVVVNPPWPTDATIDASIRRVIDEDGITAPAPTNVVKGIISNTVDKAYVESLGISDGGSGGTNTNDVREIVNESVGGTNAVKAAVFAVGGKLDKTEAENTYRRLDNGIFNHSNISCAGSGTFDLDVVGNAIGEKVDRLSEKADKAELEATMAEAGEAKAAANNANVWSMATYNFMTGGRTNCWFSGTNYVFGAEAATRTRFAWEDGMDAATVPCSMALWEIRDGTRQLVWDQKDWPTWYWSFKSAQMAADIQGRIDALGNAVTNASNYAWAKRYASDGTPNPDASTTFIDTPSVTLSPGMKWETVATVSGAAYWTIVGNGAVIGGSGTNATLRIQDFEGNDIMTVTKGEHRLAWLERGEITGHMIDADGWICFDMLADAEPVGYFSTTLDSSDFLPQTDPNCPAQYSWEAIGGGKWRVHFLLKSGIQAKSCFAKFQVEVEGQTVIRYNAGQEISGGLIYNGVKIAPDVSGSPAVGTTIQWKVVH